MKKLYFMILLVAVVAVLPANDFTVYNSINNIFDAYDATVIVKTYTHADSTMGTGFFVSEDYLVTNASVIGNHRSAKVTIRNYDYDAAVVAVHYYLDFALLKIDDYISFRYLTFTRYNPDMSDIRGTILQREGEIVTQTTGAILVNSPVRDNAALFQIDAVIADGIPGGPILDQKNHLLGFMVGNSLTRSIVNNTQFIPGGVHLAVKTDYIIPIIQIYTPIQIHYETPEGDMYASTDPSLNLTSSTSSSGSGLDSKSGSSLASSGSSSAKSDPKSQSKSESNNQIIENQKEDGILKSDDETPPPPPQNDKSTLSTAEKARLDRAEAERAERERAARERIQIERDKRLVEEKARLEKEKADREKAEKERQKAEKDRLDRERVEREQAEINQINLEKAQRLQLAEAERIRKEQAAEVERVERERLQREQTAEIERLQREQNAEKERLQREHPAEREKAQQEQTPKINETPLEPNNSRGSRGN